jgi:pilus assembly protein Flp/PilA
VSARRGGIYKGTVTLNSIIMNIRSREEGQALVEYALILSLISVVAITALTLIGTNVNNILTTIATAL